MLKHWLRGTGLALTVALSLAPASPPPSAGPIWYADGPGHTAEVEFSDNLGGGRVNLFRNGATMFVFYETWTYDPNSEQCTFLVDQFGNTIETCVFHRTIREVGWGEVLDSAVTNANGTIHWLATVGGTGFHQERCVTDDSTGTSVTTCGPDNPAGFDLTWTVQPQSGWRLVGGVRQTLDNLTFDTIGAIHAKTAYVNGTANGRTLTNSPGRIASTIGTMIARE